jgi:hypothetical protein
MFYFRAIIPVLEKRPLLVKVKLATSATSRMPTHLLGMRDV